MGTLFGFVAPIAAQNTDVKVEWSSRHFRKIPIFGSNMGFHAHVRHVLREMLKTEGDRSGDNRGNLGQSIVHG